jgi:hypothetical protein
MPGRSDLLIVVFPQDEDGTFPVRLMQSGGTHGINFDGDDFLVARTRTLDSAKDYAKGLADILLFKVIQIAPS